MTEEHLRAILVAAEAKEADGWMAPAAGRTLTLYVSSGGALLTVSRVEAVRVDKALVSARTAKGEVYVLALVDLFAGATDAPTNTARKAGFV